MEKGFGGKVFDTSGTIIKVFDFFLHNFFFTLYYR